MGRQRLAWLAWGLLLAGNVAVGTPVTDAGDAGSGTRRDVISAASPDNTIYFATDITTIFLQNQTATTTDWLTIAGHPSGLAAALNTLVPATGSGPNDCIMPNDSALSVAIRGLPLPGVVLDGGGATRPLEFGATSGTTRLKSLVPQNASCLATNLPVNNPGESLDQNNSASTSLLSGNGISGGALYISAVGELYSVAFLNNTLTVAPGSATTGEAQNTGGSANAYGDGAYLGSGGTVTSSLFYGNSAIAPGGALADGGTATGATMLTWANDDAFRSVLIND